MKKMMVVFGALALSASAFADAAPMIPFNPMETIVQCKPAQMMMDTGYSLEIRQQRIGSYKDAVFSQFFLGRRNTTTFENVQVSDVTDSSDENTVVRQIFTAPVRNGEFKLDIDLAQRDANGQAPATLEIGSESYDLLCQHLMMAL